LEEEAAILHQLHIKIANQIHCLQIEETILKRQYEVFVKNQPQISETLQFNQSVEPFQSLFGATTNEEIDITSNFSNFLPSSSPSPSPSPT